MPRPTGRGYALIALAVATYLAGRVVGTWELYLVAFASWPWSCFPGCW